MLALTALVLRLGLAPWMAHNVDMDTFTAWGLRLASVGPASFLSEHYWCDYLPGYLYVLWAAGKVAALLPPHLLVSSDALLRLQLHTLVFKMPNLLADVATAYLLWRMLHPTTRDRKLWLPAVYLFNPAVVANSTLWGQVDSYHALCLVGALTLLCRGRLVWASIVLGYAAAVKPHTAVLLPAVAVFALTARLGWWRVLLCPVGAVLTFAATFLPFNGWSIRTLPEFIVTRFAAAMGQYDGASINALNFWYLLGKNWSTDAATFVAPWTVRQAGIAICGAGYVLAAVWYLHRRRQRGWTTLWESAAIIYLVTFLFVTRAHERHVFPFFAMILLVAGFQRHALVPYVLVSLTYCINLGLSWRYITAEVQTTALCAPAVAAGVCAANLLALPLMLWVLVRPEGRESASARGSPAGKESPDDGLAEAWRPRHGRLLLVLIVLFAGGTRLVRLNAPPERYFDEVYHAYTAEQWVKGNSDAWLWSTTAPDKGCSYEWTHPPLAKLAMAASMRLFGVHPWAWRLPAALLGTACVVLIYFIARALFEPEVVALLAAAFAALDALPLVLSRIAMNDVYCATFILVAVLAGLRSRPVVAALSVGVALACKWSALYTLPLLALIHLLRVKPPERWRQQRLITLAALYGVLVPAVYVGSYLPFFRAGHTVGKFVELQRQMWFYHIRLKAKHAFASPAWRWPLTSRSVWCYTSKGKTERDRPTSPPNEKETATDSTTSAAPPGSDEAASVTAVNIYAAGNPVVWLAGLGAVAFTIIHAVRRRDPSLAIVSGGYLMFWAPWLASPRIMFIYHYLPALPFLYVALAWSLVYTGVQKRGMILLLAASAGAFAMMYPYLTAIPLPMNLTPGHLPWQQ